MNNILGEKAIVIGGSLAGIMAARVLSDHYERVIVVERDELPSEGEHRRGVPHGRHAHGLLAGGLRVTEELFPGITDEFVADGAVKADAARDGIWFFEGDWMQPASSGLNSVLSTRPFLESRLRRRLLENSNIEFASGRSVRGMKANRGRVIGITTERAEHLADLVVDASGRGSQAPKWLEAIGFECPRAERVEVDLTYTTRLFRLPTETADGQSFIVIPPTPEGKRGGVMLGQENGLWIVTMLGHFGHSAPPEIDGFLDYAASLASPKLYEILRNAKPIGDAVTFRFPASVRRRYEELRTFPKGFLVFGDAICSFNPIYGQGMSSAALQAMTLKKCLAAGDENLEPRFFKAAAKIIDAAWNTAVGADLKMPEVEGKRTAMTRFFNWYVSKLHKAAHSDAEATKAFLSVAQLCAPPPTILSPRIALRVLLKNAFGPAERHEPARKSLPREAPIS